MHIEYRGLDSSLLCDVLKIYRAADWTAYLNDDTALARAFDRSLYTLGAFEGTQLVGFIRCVGDGEHIVYVQDLIVDVPHKRQGIGSALMRHAMERFRHVRMFTLITDGANEAANAFYKSLGMQQFSQGGIMGYMR